MHLRCKGVKPATRHSHLLGPAHFTCKVDLFLKSRRMREDSNPRYPLQVCRYESRELNGLFFKRGGAKRLILWGNTNVGYECHEYLPLTKWGGSARHGTGSSPTEGVRSTSIAGYRAQPRLLFCRILARLLISILPNQTCNFHCAWLSSFCIFSPRDGRNTKECGDTALSQCSGGVMPRTCVCEQSAWQIAQRWGLI